MDDSKAGRWFPLLRGIGGRLTVAPSIPAHELTDAGRDLEKEIYKTDVWTAV